MLGEAKNDEELPQAISEKSYYQDSQWFYLI